MTTAVAADARLVAALVSRTGLQPRDDERTWNHMGALIVDAALQPRTRYKTVVWPRARKIRDEWPDASTTAGFATRLASVDLPTYLAWRPTSPKITKIHDLTSAMTDLRIDTVGELASRLSAPTGDREVRSALRRVRHVGPKTLDYIAILAGSTDQVAVDQHIAAFVRAAGAQARSYDDVAAVVKAAATDMGCSPGALDAAIWNHMSEQTSKENRAARS